MLAEHGKSFHWAGHLLDKATLDDAATLYAFCRLADDAVDSAKKEWQASEAIACIRRALRSGSSGNPVLQGFLELACRHDIDPRLPNALIDGIAGDLGRVAVQTRAELLRYCYRVAGTVGAMMCPVLGVTERKALPFAIDLGIAMQLTNIARDVLEDAGRGRVYLPADEFAGEVTPEGLLRGLGDQRLEASRVVLDVLALAEAYYRSADRGLRFIPVRNRLAILAASRIYRAIGTKIRKAPGSIWNKRVFVTFEEKLLRTSGALAEPLVRPFLLNIGPAGKHEDRLHIDLSGLLPS